MIGCVRDIRPRHFTLRIDLGTGKIGVGRLCFFSIDGGPLFLQGSNTWVNSPGYPMKIAQTCNGHPKLICRLVTKTKERIFFQTMMLGSK